MCQRERERCLPNWVLACLPGDASTNPVPVGVSEECENITYGASCAVGFEPANHTELSCFAIGQLESNSVPPYPVCEEKKCVDVATSDSSTLAPDCTDLTSGDQCNVMCAAGSTVLMFFCCMLYVFLFSVVCYCLMFTVYCLLFHVEC